MFATSTVGRLFARIVGPSVLVAAGIVALTAPAADAVGDPPGWYDGPIAYSTILDCSSLIWGGPPSGKGVAAWVGAVADLDESPPQPGVNQGFDIHVVVGGIGNACSGTGIRPGFTLPAGVTLDTSQPIRCYLNGSQTTNAADCPQTGSVAVNYFGSNSFAYISGRTQDSNLWPAGPGTTWEFHFRVKSSTVQNMATLQGHVAVADGNNNPTLKPKVYFNVYPSTAAPSPSTGTYRVVYDTPSTFATQSYNTNSGAGTITPVGGLMSEGKVFTQSQPGLIYVRRATSSARLDSAATSEQIAVPVDNSRPAWKLYTDWDSIDGFAALVPGQTYYWRLGFMPTGGSLTWGAKQSFQALSQTECLGAPVTVSLANGQLPTDGNDVILGTAGNDTINALGGNDSVCSLGGNDVVDGGEGDDTVDAGTGDDVIVPRGGNDASFGGSGSDTVSYYGNSFGVTLTLESSLWHQNTGGAGLDRDGGIENVIGTAYDDVLGGSNSANRIIGGAGNDWLQGNGGNDLLMPGAGNDAVDGTGTAPGATPGSDTVSYADQPSSKPLTLDLRNTTAQNTVNAGTDTITGILNLIGGAGSDRLTGSNSSGYVRGGNGHDYLYGVNGHDRLYGDAGNDRLYGGSGNDRMYGVAGNDLAYGGAGNDLAYGGAGNDRLYGDSGKDKLYGDSGRDKLDGGSSSDRCYGGSSRDSAKRCEKKSSIP